MALRGLGTENKNQVILASVLGVLALIFLVKFLWGYFIPSPAPESTIAAPQQTTVKVATNSSGTSSHTAARLNTNLDPTLHPELMLQAESMTYTGKGRNIFSQQSAPIEIPKAIKPIRPFGNTPVTPAGPPQPPPPPAIDLKFYGYSAVKTGAKKAFLLHGDDIFIANEGDVVDRRYRLIKIDPFSVQVEDLAYKDTQTLHLIQN
jgi:hypothetical protein